MTVLSAKEAGFTLIEVLVALVVTAFLLVIIMNGAVQAQTRAKVVAERREAVRLAAALYAERANADFVEGLASGDEGKIHWQAEERSVMRDPRGLLVLSEIHLTLTNAKSVKLYELVGRKLKALPAS